MIIDKKNEWIRQLMSHLLMVTISLLCIIPLVIIISTSLSSEPDLTFYGPSIWPRHVDLSGYTLILRNPENLINAYEVSLLVTALGTVLGVTVAALCAWPLSRQDYVHRKKVSFLIIFTLLFNGGMIPSYITTVTVYHLKDNLLVLILPYLANGFFIILLRTFFQTIPMSIVESARIDGASEILTFSKIVVPLAAPGLATIALFYCLLYWNDWYLGLLYIDNARLVPLQLLLAHLMNNIEYIKSNINNIPSGFDILTLPKESARMAMSVLAIGPMLLVFVFFQKYFVRGITLGAIKG